MDHKADYGVFFGEPGVAEGPDEILRGVLGAELVLAEPLGDRAVGLRFSADGAFAALNEAHPLVTPNGMLGYEDDEIPYDRYAFEIGFARDLTEDTELAAVLELAHWLKRGNISVMVDEGGEKALPLDENAASRDQSGSCSCSFPILAAVLLAGLVVVSAVLVDLVGMWALPAMVGGLVAAVAVVGVARPDRRIPSRLSAARDGEGR